MKLYSATFIGDTVFIGEADFRETEKQYIFIGDALPGLEFGCRRRIDKYKVGAFVDGLFIAKTRKDAINWLLNKCEKDVATLNKNIKMLKKELIKE